MAGNTSHVPSESPESAGSAACRRQDSWDELLEEAHPITTHSEEAHPITTHSPPTLDVDDWDEIYDQEEMLCQQEAEEQEAACEHMPDVESAEEADPGEPSGKVTSWWAQELRQAARALGLVWPEPHSKPVQVVSACTGSSAEAAVLKAGIVGRSCVLLMPKGLGSTGRRAEETVVVSCFGFNKLASP